MLKNRALAYKGLYFYVYLKTWCSMTDLNCLLRTTKPVFFHVN